jgi:CubicO group peptidase (beta-lactamase class C family)
MDAQVLGLVLTYALRKRGNTLSSYLEEKIWSKGGFQADATWWLDNDKNQMEMAIGTLGITTRDYARFGWLYLNGGLSPFNGERLIPEKWIHDSTHADRPHLQPGPNAHAGVDSQYFGYGFQWWLCPRDEDPCQAAGDYMAIGIYNQFIYISPQDRLVIVKNSANANYGDNEDADRESEEKALMAFRSIAAQARALERGGPAEDRRGDGETSTHSSHVYFC